MIKVMNFDEAREQAKRTNQAFGLLIKERGYMVGPADEILGLPLVLIYDYGKDFNESC